MTSFAFLNSISFFFQLIIILFPASTPSWHIFLNVCYQFNSKLFASVPSILSTPSNASEVLKSLWNLQTYWNLDWLPILVHSCHPGISLHHHLGVLSVSPLCWVSVSWVLCLLPCLATLPTTLGCSTASSNSLRKGMWEKELFQLFISEKRFILSAPLMIIWLGIEF